MPNTVLGKVSLTPRGAYRSGTRYTALGLVGYEGGGYIALREVQDIAPSDDGVNWMLLAARGGEGIQGEQGIPGYVFTPSVSAEGVISWTNNGDLPNPDPIDITGPEGPRGPQGDSVVSIEHTGGTGAPGTTDTYTVKLSNGSIAGTFQVYNGADGNGAGDFKADGSVPMTGNLQMGGNRVVGVGSAQESTDAVNKSDLDKAIQSVTITTDAEPVEGSHNPVQSGGVFSALSNKVNQIITLGPYDDPNTITISGFYRLNGTKTNVPPGCEWGNLIVAGDNNTVTQYISDHLNTKFLKRTARNSLSVWGEWILIATATPPQEYNLQLADGLTGTATYCKTQEGVVLIHGWVQNLVQPEQGKPAIIATLPDGFRPRNNCRFALISSATAPSIGLVRVEISTAGTINLVAWNEVGKLEAGVSIDITFLSAS